MAVVRDFMKMLGIPTKEERVIEKFHSRVEAEMFGKICTILRESAPKKSEIIVLEASIPKDVETIAEADVAEYSTYVRNTGKDTYFQISEKTKHEIASWLLQLRENMDGKQRSDALRMRDRWRQIRIVVDVPMDKYTADFKY